MSCRAILHETGQESVPLLLVRTGELTPRQCDHEFRGKTGECPTCKAMIERADLHDGSTFAQAMLKLRERGQTVTYRRFGYGLDGGVEPWRVCYWGHPPRYWEGVEFRDCQNPVTNAHAVHLEVIRRHYEKQFKPSEGFVVKVEPKLRRPGDPPRPYSPDLAIYGPANERLVAVEYQRSHESYEKFCERDDLRRLEKWASVDWWFDDTLQKPDSESPTVYSKSQMHRTHLALLVVPFYRCWVDHATLELKADYGKAGDIPPLRRARVARRVEKAELSDCSTAKIIRLLEEGPEREIIRDYIKPLEARPGSELRFRAHTQHSLERERRLAMAVLVRQERLEQQDRRHREWEECQRRKRLEAGEIKQPFPSGQNPEFSGQVHTPVPAAMQAAPQRMQSDCSNDADRPQNVTQWGFPSGSLGWSVRWLRGKPFQGVVTGWHHGRPRISDVQGTNTRLAWSKFDYEFIGFDRRTWEKTVL